MQVFSGGSGGWGGGGSYKIAILKIVENLDMPQNPLPDSWSSPVILSVKKIFWGSPYLKLWIRHWFCSWNLSILLSNKLLNMGYLQFFWMSLAEQDITLSEHLVSLMIVCGSIYYNVSVRSIIVLFAVLFFSFFLVLISLHFIQLTTYCVFLFPNRKFSAFLVTRKLVISIAMIVE